MKKLLLILLAISFIACSDDNNDKVTPTELLGKWKCEYFKLCGERVENTTNYTIEFLNNWQVSQYPDFKNPSYFTLNGKIIEWDSYGDIGEYNFKYNYSFSSDTLILNTLNSECYYMINSTSYYTKTK